MGGGSLQVDNEESLSAGKGLHLQNVELRVDNVEGGYM